ncbi:lysophospholipase [Acrasis kona]|uniref:Lysophospholipase n=1 Tax=Acrasis kona TaxID=1008807 RepID=A0AAW2YMV9_9EUKA
MRCVLPNAPSRPITVNNGYVMPGWYDIKSFDRMGDAKKLEDEEGILQSKENITKLLDEEFKLFKSNQSGKVILGGFSQGAAISLLTGLSYPNNRLKAIVAASGYTLQRWKKEVPNHITVHEQQKNIPVYIHHGEDDQVVSYQYASMCYEELKNEHGVNLIIETDPYQGHHFTDEQVSFYHKLLNEF